MRRLDVAVAGDRADPQRAACEVGRVGVDEADAGIDQLWRSVHEVLGEGDRRCHVGQHRRRRSGDAAGRAQQLLEHAVGVDDRALGVVAVPDDDRVVASQARDVGPVLGAGGGAVDQSRTVDLGTGCVELLRPDVVAAAAQAARAVPGDDEAAVAEGGNARVVAVGREVAGADDDLGPELGAEGVETLRVDDAVVGPPGGDEAATGQCRDVRTVLVARGGGVDGDQAAELVAVVVEALRREAVAAGVAAGVAPECHEAAAAECRQLRLDLRGAAGGVERDLGAERIAGGVEALRQHVVVVAAAGIAVVAAVGNDEAAIRETQHCRLPLVGDDRSVRAELVAHRVARRVVALRVDTVAAAAVLAVGAPGDDEAAAGQRADGRRGLVAQRLAVDLKLGADGGAIGSEALGEDAVGVTVLPVPRFPRDDIAAVVGTQQTRDHRLELLAGLIGVDLFLGAQGHQRSGCRLGRHIDNDIVAAAGVAGTVGDADAHAAAGQRARRSVGVRQVLNHALDRGLGGSGLPGDLERAASQPVQSGAQGADGHAAVQNVGARDADLAGAAALVADRQLVVKPAGARQVADRQLAVLEAGGAGVGQLHVAVDLLPGLGLRLGEADAGGDVLQRQCRHADAVGDGDLDLAGVAAAAVAIAQANADVAVRGAGRRRRVQVGDGLHDGLHRGGGGAGIEGDRERSHPCPAPGVAADERAADADIAARHAHLPGAAALVLDAERVVGGAVGEEPDPELPAAEVGRVDVGHRHVEVDRPRRAGVKVGVGRRVAEVADQAQIAEHRVGAGARQLCGVAEDLGADLVGVESGLGAGRLVVVGIGNDEVARAQVGDGRQVLGAVGRGNELAFPVDRHPRSVVLADVDVTGGAGAAHVVVVVVPGDDETACGQTRHLRLVLPTAGAFVDQELRPELVARRVDALGIDAIAAAIVARLVLPDDDESAAGQRRYAGRGLSAAGDGVDEEGGAEGPSGTQRAAVDAVTRAVQALAVFPDEQQVAVGLRRHVGQVLRADLRRASDDVDARLGRGLGAGVVEAAHIDVGAVRTRRPGLGDISDGEAAGI